jgi:hypothetical protein
LDLARRGRLAGQLTHRPGGESLALRRVRETSRLLNGLDRSAKAEMPFKEAAIEGAKLRFRLIQMTSFAFG